KTDACWGGSICSRYGPPGNGRRASMCSTGSLTIASTSGCSSPEKIGPGCTKCALLTRRDRKRRQGSAFVLEHDHTQRRQVDLHRLFPPVMRHAQRVALGGIADTAAAVDRGVGIEAFRPPPAHRQSDMVAFANHRSEVRAYHHCRTEAVGLADIRQNAVIGV